MARRALSPDGRVAYVEMSRAEFAKLLDCRPEDLITWAELLPAEDPVEGIYRFRSQEALRLARQRAAVLRTRMSLGAVKAIEAEGKLDAYASLAKDCPAGITAHVYRSFLVLVLVQQKTGLMLDAEGLALRANLLEMDPETSEPRQSAAMARKHLRLLQAVGLLRAGEGRWEFSRLPSCLTRSG
ncbi:hypothetical protein [Miltoncostaea oceani]|uniref:hypothetical protein n=1 Tax=Miltoncostaea oceani TaxID=2843216 RepID=UPI001C3CCBDC|nr:hypothetical protein [Miltoncostaea oceani]